MAAVLLTASLSNAALAAGGAASSVSVKMGYFNLLQVKASYPEAAAATSLEEKAKEMLRQDVDKANDELIALQKANKPKEEVEKRKNELQIQIAAKQQAMAQLLQSNSSEANRNIANAVLSVAKDKGLDVVIDAAGIFAGGEKFANSGEDVTELVLKRLVPQAVRPAEPARPAAENK